MSKQLTVEQAISWLNGKGDENTILAIKEMGVLRYLENVVISYQGSRSPYSGSLANGGTLIWRIPHLIPTHNYSEGQSVSKVPQWDVIVSKNITRRAGTFKNEYFDYRMATPEQAVASVNMIVGSLGTSAAADTNSNFWTIQKKYFDIHGEQTICLPDLVAKKVLSEAEARAITVQIAHKRNDLTQIYNSTSYGVNPMEYKTTINGAGAINLSQVLLRLNNSVSAFDLAKAMITNPFADGVANPNAIIGGRIIIDNMLNLKVGQNVAWSEDTEHDTKGFLGLIAHNDFFAFPVLEPSFGVREVPNNLNHNYIVEYAFTSAFLREKLACAIVDDFRAGVKSEYAEMLNDGTEANPDWVYVVKKGKTVELMGNLYFDEANTSFASGTTAVATISGNVLTAVDTGTSTITATNGTNTATFKVKVIA